MDQLKMTLAAQTEYRESVEAVLEAVEHLGEELASRDTEDMSFTVTVPQDPPAVKVLAELINELGEQLDNYHNNLSGEILDKSQALAQAYNALQQKNDEIQSELTIAKKIQRQLIPVDSSFPQLKELSFGGYYESMDNIGGDIYDVIRFGKNVYGLLMADVSGHGIPAALITALLKIAFRSKARYDIGPAEVCKQVNADLLPILSELDFFVTAYFALIDLERGVVSYTNCGHHPVLVYQSKEKTIIELDTKGMLLGTFDDFNTEQDTYTPEPGDIFFFFTDGIIEARNFMGEEYQDERLKDAFLEAVIQGLGAHEIVQSIHENVTQFCIGADKLDDQSMFVMEFHGRVSGPKSVLDEDKEYIDSSDNTDDPSSPKTKIVVEKPSKEITEKTQRILHRYKELMSEKEYGMALGLIESLHILAPSNKQISKAILNLQQKIKK